MYRLSRALLILAFGCLAYCLVALLPVAWPWSAFVFAGGVYRWLSQRRTRPTELGSARWADEQDLRQAGMLNAPAGFILGRIPTSGQLWPRVQLLFSRHLSAEQACHDFFPPAGRSRTALVRLPQAIHTAVFSPSGGGKGTSGVVPFLMNCSGESTVTVDFKGENARLTAQLRRKAFGQQIVLLDPFHAVTKQPDCFNPLDFIGRDSPLALDECADLANALVIRTGEEKEPHWNDSAEAWIKGVIAVVVRYGDEGTRSLQTVREIFSDPDKLDLAVKLMCESDAWNGMLARIGGQLRHYVDKEKSSTLTTVARHLRFLDTLAVAESTKTSTFDPAKLRSGRMSIYLVLPPEHMRTQAPLLRMWIGSCLRAVVRGGLGEQRKVHFLLDEAAALGSMDAIDDAVDKFRGYGVRLQFYYQSLGQLKKCFLDGQDQTLLSNTTQVFFGVNDPMTAEYVSSRLGEHTIVLESGGSGSGNSWQYGSGQLGQDSGSHSSNSNTNWQLQARKLLKPEEVLALPPRAAITFTSGLPPILTTLLRYYEEPDLGRPRTWLRRQWDQCRVLAASLLVAGFWLTAAVLLTVSLESGFALPAASPPAGPPAPADLNYHSRMSRP